MIAARSFRAPVWAWLLTASGVALFVTLGTWQVTRGLAKARASTVFEDSHAPAREIVAAPSGEVPTRATATGFYVADRQLLQDGQSHRHRPGYHVWTPLRRADGSLVVVSRGWLGQGDTAPLGVPAGEQRVTGFWRALPEPGLRLASTNNCPAAPTFPLTVLYPTTEELRCLLGPAVLPGVLLLDADASGGYVREWSHPGIPPARHYGYAFQWYALAVAAIIVFAVVNRKSRS
ncbi:MAG TPA: SURF1 family protein [Verrucomicrobiae bacterium]|nr:SURF1 family protein [Verrucomicrobiae bacterium]